MTPEFIKSSKEKYDAIIDDIKHSLLLEATHLALPHIREFLLEQT